ncbi:unnamed protein product [Miscanthus lutarioriparius]|uniref:Uncharacterized protein n=1 Tax=Miscanthus lutarioriparius TaxID=422564 RepID=A0A811RFJ5_9POAL|nr:unnamed protein product [Miscanthus lutarioriparius]
MTTTTTTRRRRGARSASAGQRLRRLISFLSRHRLYRTAHTYRGAKTCVFFDAAHLRRMMLRDRWAAASSYALSFVNYRDCSREADELNHRILALRVLTAFAAGQARSVETLFRRMYAYLRFKPDRDRIAIRRLLLAMRSDDTKSSRLYGRFKPRAVQGIMDLAAKCPELKAKTRLPRYMSLGHPESWRNTPKDHQKHNTNLPARTLARSFLPKRPPQISHKKVNHKTNCSDAPSTAAFEGMLSTPPAPAKMFPVSSTNDTVTQAATQREEAEITKAPAAASNLVVGLRVPRQRRPNPQYIGPEWIA